MSTPRLSKRLGKRSSPFGDGKARLEARYQAADWSILRSLLLSSVTDAKRDISASTRTEVMRKARHFYQNSPICRGMIERIVTFIVGSSGIQPSPKSSSDRWNQRSRQFWDRWAKRPEVTKKISLTGYQRQFVRATLVDGDCFTLFAEGGLLQLIEGHRVGSTTGDVSDGVTVDLAGRPLSYQLLDESRQPDRPLDAQDVVHHAFFERASQPRGMSILAPAILTLHDLDDIIALEKQGVKSASSITDVVKTPTAEANYEETVRSGMTTGDEGERQAYYAAVFGAGAKVLRTGDDFNQYRSERPSAAWSGFVQFMADAISLSTGFPPSVLTGSKMGGADARRDLATAQRQVEVWQSEVASQMDLVWEFVIENAAGLGSAPANWRDVEWMYPVRLTVDAGREAQADRDDLRSGVITLEEFCARWGLDWRTHLAQLKEEQVAVADADETGLLTQRLYGNPNSAPPVTPGGDGPPAADGQAGDKPSSEDTPTAGDSSQLSPAPPPGVDKPAAPPPPAKTPAPVKTPAAPTVDVQAQALNGAQLAAVQEAVAAVSNKTMSPEAAKQMLYIALPATPRSDIDAMVDAAAAFTPAPPDETAPTGQ